MVKILYGLLLENKLNEDCSKFQISDNFLSEDKRLDALNKEFRDDISWEQTKNCFGSDKQCYNEMKSKYIATY